MAGIEELERRLPQVFALVTEALAGATEALLGGETVAGRAIVDADRDIDQLTREIEQAIWAELDARPVAGPELRRFVGLLLVLPELERSADLAEHIAQRAVTNLGSAMTPASRGIVQRMSDLALSMWQHTADSYLGMGTTTSLDEADDEIDQLRDRLLEEVRTGTMPIDVASQVTLLARFYERLGDHAVNLARRIALIPELAVARLP